MTATQASDAKADVQAAAAEYLDGDFAQASAAYLAQFKFKDGLLAQKGGAVVSGDAAYLTEATIKTAVAEAQVKAEIEFDKQIKALMNTFNTSFDNDNYTKANVAADVLAIFNACTGTSVGSYDYTCTTSPSETVSITGCINDDAILGSSYATVIAAQIEDEVDNVATLAATDTSAYSNYVDDWKLVLNAASNRNDQIGAGTSAPTYADVLGLTGSETYPITYTAKGYVEDVIDAQVAAIRGASTLEAVATAKAYVALVMNGCKIGDKFLGVEKNWYIEAVPTAAELEADTSVEARKELAITKVKAALNAKQVALLDNATPRSLGLNQRIAALEKKATLTAAEKAALANLKADRENLLKYFAAAEEVFAARINYETTTTGVDSKANAATSDINGYALHVTETIGFADATRTALTRLNTLAGWVADIKAEAALLETQKDVNGQPYYNAELLKKNLDDAVEYLYTDNWGGAAATYSGAQTRLGGSAEAALINAKQTYIDFIYGTFTSGLKDSKGKAITAAWNDPEDTNGTGANVTVMKNGTDADKFVVNAADYDKYDDAQKEALEALIKETEAAIEAAKTVAEVKEIFVAAHDKYVDIPTTADHADSWGKELALAYTKASYDTELKAYVEYFWSTKVASTLTYPAVFEAGAGAGVKAIMDQVVYPVMYEAYTVDELATKVAEAKAAVDAIKTMEQVAADKTAVVDAIAKLPAKKAVTLADKDAITAVADLVADYNDLPGAIAVDETKLNDALTAYEALAAKELDDAFKALDAKTITGADEAAVEALRDLYDAYEAFCSDYDVTATALTNDNVLPDTKSVKKLEKELSDAKVAEVKEMMIKLPANPTAADKAQVEAARAAYEALSLEEKAQVVDTLPYKNLIDAEEALGINNDEAAKAYVQDLSIKARSTKTAKGVKITIKADVQELLDSGYTVEYKFYRSTKSNKNFGKAMITKTTGTYTNTKGVKGTKYYYKAKLVVKNAEGEVVATTPLTQCLYATRTF